RNGCAGNELSVAAGKLARRGAHAGARAASPAGGDGRLIAKIGGAGRPTPPRQHLMIMAAAVAIDPIAMAAAAAIMPVTVLLIERTDRRAADRTDRRAFADREAR